MIVVAENGEEKEKGLMRNSRMICPQASCWQMTKQPSMQSGRQELSNCEFSLLPFPQIKAHEISIIAPGNSWTGGHSWMEGSDSSGATMFKIKDPLNNTGTLPSSPSPRLLHSP
jgi:hypothetical protein